MNENLILAKNAEWEDYAAEHILFLRPADSIVAPSAFECVKVTAAEDGKVEFLHTVIFIDDYLCTYEQDKSRLDNILSGFGYNGLDDLVKQTATETPKLLYKEDGDIDRVNSPGYMVDLRLLASLICESREGELIPAEVAAAEVGRLTGHDCREFILGLSR